jgi:hypothetical protein
MCTREFDGTKDGQCLYHIDIPFNQVFIFTKLPIACDLASVSMPSDLEVVRVSHHGV